MHTFTFSQDYDLKIQFEETHNYSSEENGVFFSPSFYPLDIVSDTLQNIYLLDSGLSTLMSFDKDGTLRWQTGTAGRGPGDFERASGMVTNGFHLFISNQAGSRIDKFDLNGTYMRSYNLNDIGNLITLKGFIEPDILVATKTTWGILGTRILVLRLGNNSIVIENEFEVNVAPEINLGNGLSSEIDINIIDNFIFAGNKVTYEISMYDLSGQKIKTYKKDFDKIVRPGFKNEGGSRSIRDFGGVTPFWKVQNNYLITQAVWPTNVKNPDEYVRNIKFGQAPPIVNYSNSLDIFDQNGNLVYTKEYPGYNHPEIGSIIYKDSNGFIYARKDSPEPTIIKYRLVIDN